MIVRLEDKNFFVIGSGFLCHPKGYLLTSAHFINLTDSLGIIAPQPVNTFAQRSLTQAQVIPATVAQFDPVKDVALLKLSPGPTVSVPDGLLAHGVSVEVGTSVGCLGFPWASRQLHVLKATSTIICGKSKFNDVNTLHLDANLHEGNSGGPVIEIASNKVIGIASERFSPTGPQPMILAGGVPLGTDSTISFATPIEYGIALLTGESLNV